MKDPIRRLRFDVDTIFFEKFAKQNCTFKHFQTEKERTMKTLNKGKLINVWLKRY